MINQQHTENSSGNWQCKIIQHFFSAENIDALQQGMINGVKISNNFYDWKTR